MKVLVMTSGMGLGHLVRACEIAWQLREGGDVVAIACGAERASAVLNWYRFRADVIHDVRLRAPLTLGIGTPDERDLREALRTERAAIRRHRPDLVISDWRITAGIAAHGAGVRHVPVINSNWGSFAGCPEVANARRQRPYRRVHAAWLRRLRSLPGFCEERSIFAGDQLLIADSAVFRRCATLPRSDVRWLGPVVPRPTGPRRVRDAAALVLHAGGHDRAALRSVALDAARYCGMPYEEAEIPAPPARPQVPRLFPAALAKAQVVVTHGGSGSLYQSLLAGIPVVVVPQHLEHCDNGDAVLDAGVGAVVRAPTRRALVQAIDVAQDLATRTAASQLGSRLRSCRLDVPQELRQ